MKDAVKKRIELFKKGLSIKEVADITGEKYKTVEGTARAYRKSGGKVNKLVTNHVNHTYFDEIDSENKAYLLGFFLADGCIDGSRNRNGKYNNRLLLQNSVDDLEVVKLFNAEVCPKSTMSFKNNQDGVNFRKTQCVIRCTSEHITSTLINKYNFCRKKAYNQEFKFPFETIPTYLHRHFIRGFFDGDGNVDFSILKNKNGTSTDRFQYGFITNSRHFAEQLSCIICGISDGVSGTIREVKGKTTSWFTLRFNTNRINNLEKRYAFYKYLYFNSTIFLSRKKIKFDSFFEHRGKLLV